jgi:hypothetical protein
MMNDEMNGEQLVAMMNDDRDQKSTFPDSRPNKTVPQHDYETYELKV